jgi:hypothetical protein
MPSERRFRNDGTKAPRFDKPDDGDDRMKENDEDVVHAGIVAKSQGNPEIQADFVIRHRRDRCHGADGLRGPASSCGWRLLARTSLPAGLTQPAGVPVSRFLLLRNLWRPVVALPTKAVDAANLRSDNRLTGMAGSSLKNYSRKAKRNVSLISGRVDLIPSTPLPLISPAEHRRGIWKPWLIATRLPL